MVTYPVKGICFQEGDYGLLFTCHYV